MKRKVLVGILVLCAAGVLWCWLTPCWPHAVTHGMMGDGKLSVSAASSAMTEWGRPRIEEVKVWVDGKPLDVPYEVGAWNGKNGWCDSATFAAPEQGSDVVAELKVWSNFRHYWVTQRFVPCSDEVASQFVEAARFSGATTSPARVWQGTDPKVERVH